MGIPLVSVDVWPLGSEAFHAPTDADHQLSKVVVEAFGLDGNAPRVAEVPARAGAEHGAAVVRLRAWQGEIRIDPRLVVAERAEDSHLADEEARRQCGFVDRDVVAAHVRDDGRTRVAVRA